MSKRSIGRAAGPAVLVKFKHLPDMFPFSEGGSPYSLRICGKSVAGHLIDAVRRQYPNFELVIEATDNLLANNPEILAEGKTMTGSNTHNTSDMQCVEGNRLVSSHGETIIFQNPWDLLGIMTAVLSCQQAFRSPSSEIEDTVLIEGNVFISDGVRICRGATLKGPIYLGTGVFVGNQSLLRGPCSIEANCKIGYGAELKHALVQSETVVGPLCFVADSVVGTRCSLGALARTSNLRLDRKTVSIQRVEGFKDTGLLKLGCAMGEKVKTGVGVIVMPGRRIGNNVHVGPQVIVQKNFSSNKRYLLRQDLITQQLDQ